MEIGYTVYQIDEHTWKIEETNHRLGVWCYLLEGENKAALIDSGLGNIPLRSIIDGLTDKPVEIINTHYHGDHVGGNGDYDVIYLNKEDRPGYYETVHGIRMGRLPRPINEKTIDVEDGDEIELGGRTLRIYTTPGHSPGHICVLDVQNRVLYTGDHCGRGVVLVFDTNIGLPGYRKSLQKLIDLGDLYDVTCPAHGETPLEKEVLQQLADIADDIIAGKLEEKDYINPHFHGYKTAQVNELGFMYPPIER